MPQRQQRTNNARGVLPVASRRIQTDFLAPISQITGAVWDFLLPADASRFTLTGIPAWTLSDGGLALIGAIITGTLLRVTWPIVPIYPTTLTVPGNDPALRTDHGAYLAPYTQFFANAVWPPQNVPLVGWVVQGQAGAVITLGNNAPNPPVFVTPTCGFFCTGPGASIAIAQGIAGLDVTFPAAPVPGNIITLVSPMGSVWEETGACWNTATEAPVS